MIRVVHSGSRIRILTCYPYRIPDPDPDFLSIPDPDPDFLSIPDPDPDFLSIPDPGSRGQKVPGSATLSFRCIEPAPPTSRMMANRRQVGATTPPSPSSSTGWPSAVPSTPRSPSTGFPSPSGNRGDSVFIITQHGVRRKS